jgi:hypothetical protein
VVCDERGISGGGKHCDGNGAHLGCIHVFYHGYVALRPRAWRDRRCNSKSLLGERFRQGNLVSGRVKILE